MKKFTKEELSKDAQRLIKAHKKDKIFSTQDGNHFFTSHDAIFHNNGIKQNFREWDGEVIQFDADAAKEEVVNNEPDPAKEELKAAKKRVADAKKALVDAKKVYDAADKKYVKKPDDVELKKAADDAKAVYEAAQLEVDNAGTVLSALTKE